MNRLRRLRHDESGMSYVYIGMGMMAFLGASMLAIDVGMLMTGRNQAQNAADAGALAGATALVFDNYDDRTPGGPVVTSAIDAARDNRMLGEQFAVTPENVTFPTDPVSGQQNRVQVTVQRTVPTLIAQIFDIKTATIGAVATAEASPANGMTCVKPFAIPDKWLEKQTPAWDMDDTFEAFDKKGNPLANPDIYVPADRPGYTGYNNERERGQRLMIRAGSGNDINPTMYFSIAIGGITGGDEYRWNIRNCNTTVMHWGDTLTMEPGNMMGPTVQGAWDLYNMDMNAYWDHSSKTVKGSAFSRSPRVFPIPLYDPHYYDENVTQGRGATLKVANWIGFFLEEIQGNNIWGRIIPIAGIRDGKSTAPTGAFPRAIRLVQ